MLNIYKTVNGAQTPMDEITPGCWIHLVHPDPEEIERVVSFTGTDPSFLLAALDEEETSRIEHDEGHTLIIIDIPMAEKEEKGQVIYSTIPMGVVVTEHVIVTVCLKETQLLAPIVDGKIKGLNTGLRTRFIFQIFLSVAARFLQYLRAIDKISKFVERQLHKSMKNKELIQLLDLEKSLVYFSTSLKANEITLEKILRGRILRLYEEDQELLEDVLIEVRQAIEMTEIYSNILTGTMDAFASVISNNLNIVMKVLTSITILMTIPNIVFSFYGMNVGHLPAAGSWYAPMALAVAIAGSVAIFLKRKNLL